MEEKGKREQELSQKVDELSKIVDSLLKKVNSDARGGHNESFFVL